MEFFRLLFLLVSLATLSSAATLRSDNDNNDLPLPERKDRADVDTLELVQIIWRHGDRAPYYEYPNDPIYKESLWYPHATGLRALTKKGQQDQYQLGKYLRKRYDGFLSNVYSPKEMYVQSSDTDRSIMSALANMAGLWPPTPKDPKSEWNLDFPWQAIPVHTIPKKLDNFISFGADCPRFRELEEESFNKTPFAISINEAPENVKLYKSIMEYWNMKACNFETVWGIWDTLKIHKQYNMTIPSWVTPEVYDHTTRLAALWFDSRVLLYNEEAKQVKAGPLLNILVKNMDVRRDSLSLTLAEKSKLTKSKMFAYSGHDSTIATVLGAIGVFDTQIPDYASSVIFEMHKGTPDQADGNQKDHFLKVFLRNDTSVPPFEFEIPKCGYPCRLDQFKKLFSNMILTEDEEWQTACRQGGNA